VIGIAAAETFAPLAELGLFRLAFPGQGSRSRRDDIRDGLAIVVANLASFGVGMFLHHQRLLAGVA
jgi:hypothetical protein